MTILKVTSKTKNTFDLIVAEDSKMAGQLIYESLFSFKASIHINDQKFILSPSGMLSSHISVYSNEKEYASLKMNWRGHIVYCYPDGKVLLFKSSGLFLNKYHVEDEEGSIIMTLQPEFNWTKLDYNYTVNSNLPEVDALTVLISVYAANYFIASISATI